LRAAAAEAAGEAGGEGMSELVRLALSDESVQVRAAAARVLGRLSAEEAVPLIRVALADEEAEIVAAAIEAAADARAPELAPRLRELVGASDSLTAIRALRALAQLGELDAPTFTRAVAHADPEVVREALIAGAALPEAEAHGRALLSHPRWDLRATAARVLASSGGAGAAEAVARALEREPDALVREALEEACAQLRRR
ncbi:MAG: HEAT repeat domain-containing protein, partial [Myxococcaceae bacterium]|nr:HEAT repeat domain-containing protein [Myxococcaceae bacterium]